ncbi:hypothetical protein STAFG_8026 [Streptomyces afghaniensis 772]|uniref:Uncharacterized protein n=2 Tax=Streptomyces afghaniensis TaxID=66865 RepID=S4M6S1_9ACTN|nr:hypothetical protein STAFG_8026 [Streptomyces afghaniensis 772]
MFDPAGGQVLTEVAVADSADGTRALGLLDGTVIAGDAASTDNDGVRCL